MTNSRGLLVQHNGKTLTVSDPVDKQVIATAQLDPTNFYLEVIPESRNLGVATEVCQWLLEQKLFKAPVVSSIQSNNRAAQRLIEKFSHTLLSNTRNTVTVRLEPEIKTPKLDTELSHIEQLLCSLNIDPASIHLPIQYRASQLADTGLDMFDRPTQLHPAALKALQKMQSRAAEEKLGIEIVSGYRSYMYQGQLLQNKLDKGISLIDILSVNAPPGFSEHHTGCAVDLSTPGYQPLEESFDQSPLFKWLEKHAHHYGFFMSYPTGNGLGIIYEPWHWCFHSDSAIVF